MRYNPDAESCIFRSFYSYSSCPLACMSRSSNCCVIYVQLLRILYKIIIIINNNNNNNFKFRPFLLRYTITIQLLPAKINTRDLSAMKDTLTDI